MLTRAMLSRLALALVVLSLLCVAAHRQSGAIGIAVAQTHAASALTADIAKMASTNAQAAAL